MNNSADNSGARAPGTPRPFVGINFTCCNIYCRIYKNKAGDAYEGACPKCRRKVKLLVGPGGTSKRFFDAR
ncbi:MAG: hypothetical protein FWC23_03310 [Chitinispirillia bacterium]|nr:hypothetical protein [Chitinispirillia bacterium]MCL2268204.1 hypothetical protein [Chitinispirillia bacterium]